MTRFEKWRARAVFVFFIMALTFAGGAPNKWDGRFPGGVYACSGGVDEREQDAIEDALTPTVTPRNGGWQQLP